MLRSNSSNKVQCIAQNNPSKMYRNQIPPQKIINCKDEAIKQLIYENTMLKRQLSQFMLKNAAKKEVDTRSPYESTNASMRPSFSHLSSNRNSMQNSMDIKLVASPAYMNKFSSKDQIVNDSKLVNYDNFVCQKKIGRSYRHSVDNLMSYASQTPEAMIHKKLISGQFNAHNLQTQFFNNNNQQVFSKNKDEVNKNFQSHQNNRDPRSVFTQQNCTYQSEQDQLYKEKMLKLKTKKSKSKQADEQKSINTKIKKQDNFMELNLVKAHQILKNKLQKHQVKKYTNQVQVVVKQPQKTVRKVFQKQQPQSSYFQPSTKNVNYKQLKVIPNDQDRNFIQMKKFQKFVPRNIVSGQKQNKSVLQDQKNNQSQKLKKTNQAQKKSDQKLLSKKVCLKQLRGKIYLDDEFQSSKTKRISNSKQKGQSQAQISMHEQQNRKLKNNRVQTVQSEIAFVNASKYQSLTSNSLGANQKMKKNSNQVYMEDQLDKQGVVKAKQNNKQFKRNPSNNPDAKVIKKEPFSSSNKSNEPVISLENIHMIQEEGCLKQHVQATKCQNKIKNDQLQSNIKPASCCPESSYQNSNYSNYNNCGLKCHQVMTNTKNNCRKQLSNDIYCEQEEVQIKKTKN